MPTIVKMNIFRNKKGKFFVFCFTKGRHIAVQISDGSKLISGKTVFAVLSTKSMYFVCNE